MTSTPGTELPLEYIYMIFVIVYVTEIRSYEDIYL